MRLPGDKMRPPWEVWRIGLLHERNFSTQRKIGFTLRRFSVIWGRGNAKYRSGDTVKETCSLGDVADRGDVILNRGLPSVLEVCGKRQKESVL